MKTNRNWLLLLCLVLVIALCGTVFGFAQGGGLIPGASGGASELPIPGEGEISDSGLSEPDSWTLGESSGLQLRKIELDKEEVTAGEQLTVTLGASGCDAESYLAQVTFIGLESGEKLQASARSNPGSGELTLRVRMTADGPAGTYALREVLFTDANGEAALFHSRGYDERSPSALLLPAERSFRIVEPADPNGEFTFFLSDPELVFKLQQLGSGAKATVLYGAKDKENYLAEKEIFEAAREKGFTLIFDDGNACWTFPGKSVNEPQALELEVSGEYGLSSLEELIDWTTPHYAFRLPGSGSLPGTASISLQIGQMSRFEGGGLYLYRYNEPEEKLELVAGGLSVEEGALRFQTDRCGVYLICKGPAQPPEDTVPQPEDGTEEKEYLPIDEGDTEWFHIRDQLDEAGPGVAVSVRIERDEPIPYWIIRYLCGKDVKLTLSDGSSLLTLDGLSIDPPQRRPVFKMEELQELFS